MILVRIFIPLLTVVVLYFVGRWLWKQWKSADVEQKLEDIEANEELYKKTVNVDFGEVKAEKEHLDEFKNLET